jgi:hypothetical protein
MSKLQNMVADRAIIAAAAASHNICGFDERIAFLPSQYTTWAASNEGITAIEKQKLGPRTAETAHINYTSPMPGQASADGPEVADALKSICLHKKCLRHKDWQTTFKQNNLLSIQQIRKRVADVREKEHQMAMVAQLRSAEAAFYADHKVED